MNSTIWIIIIAVLFLLVYFNNKRNMDKLRNRRGRDFRTNYQQKKKDQKKQDEDIHKDR